MKALAFSSIALLALGALVDARLSGQQVVTISTVAGSQGVAGAIDGTGAAARFSSPGGIVAGADGTLYIVDTGGYEPDTGGCIIRKMTPAGIVTTLAGKAGVAGSADGAGDAARFDHPTGVAIDHAGNIYVADAGNHTIRKITPAGNVTTLAGRAGFPGATDGAGADARFNHPQGVAIDAGGNVYVADQANYTIRKISPAGVVTTLAGLAGVMGFPESVDGAGAVARFAYPTHLAVDAGGNVLVADYLTVRRITPAGDVSTLAGSCTKYGSVDGTGAAAGFYGVRSVALDANGRVVVADANAMIRSISPEGVVTTIAGQARVSDLVNGSGGAARISGMCFIAFDPAGELWIADGLYDVVRRGVPTAALSAPIITTAPYEQSATVVAHANARLTVVCSQLTPATYRWTRDGVEVPIGDGPILTLTDLTTADTGTYVVTATNATGVSSVVIGTLTVTPGPVSSFALRHGRSGGSFLWGIAAGDDQLVAVGTGGTILTSEDGTSWTRRESGTTDWLVGVSFGAGRFVAVGDHGLILLSRDGASWQPAGPSGTTRRLNNVAYGHGLFVAVGEGGVILTSSDGSGWTAQDSRVTGWLRGLAVSSANDARVPAFVTCGEHGVILSSRDGTRWQREANISDANLEAVAAVDSYASYVAVGQYGTVIEGAVHPASVQGQPLNLFSWPRLNSSFYSNLRGLAVGANALFAMGDGGGMLSAPTTTGPWAKIPLETSSNLVAGVFRDTTLYVVGENETVLASTPLYGSRLINISTRGLVGNDSDTLISGFVVQGSTPKQVLLRAVGPTLAGAGLTNVLVAPILKLLNSRGEPIAVNSRWGTAANASELAATMERVGAFALPADSTDSALLVTLPPGVYTAHVTGASRSTGLALVEAYDADKICNDGGRAINVSTRGRVEAGQDRLIAGFVITGESSRRVLIRAAGPSLAAMGVEGVLPEPELTLFTARGNVIRTAGAWSDDQAAGETSDAARKAGAFPYVDGSKDSAFVITLTPAAYTVHVTGKNGGTGVALVEVYDLP